MTEAMDYEYDNSHSAVQIFASKVSSSPTYYVVGPTDATLSPVAPKTSISSTSQIADPNASFSHGASMAAPSLTYQIVSPAPPSHGASMAPPSPIYQIASQTTTLSVGIMSEEGTFKYFPRLPVELREYVWKFALPGP